MSVLGNIALGTARLYAKIAPTQRGGYRIARMARRLVPRAEWRGQFISAENVALDLDLATYPDCCMAVGLYELDTMRLLRRLLKAGDHFVDCGANIGYFALHAARMVGKAGRVDAFEPDPLNRARLEANLAASGGPAQVHIHAAAVSDRAGAATLYHPSDAGHNHGEASLFAPSFGQSQSYTVPTLRLDDHVESVPAVVKMDIEGAELMALKGATKWLEAAAPPAFVIEHNPPSCAAAGHRPGDLLRLVQSVNPAYRAIWIGWWKLALDAARLDGIAQQGNVLYRVT